jgi:hypothetical protein
MITKSNLDPLPGDTETYLEIPAEQRVTIPGQEVVWCKISEDNQLEFVRWDIIERYAKQYDEDINARDQTRVMCKLMVLVRDQTRKEVGRE